MSWSLDFFIWTSKVRNKLKTTAEYNGEEGNGINSPCGDLEVERKWNGNGDKKRCDREKYAKSLEHSSSHHELETKRFTDKERSEG